MALLTVTVSETIDVIQDGARKMGLPSGWPPRVPSGTRSLRVFIDGTTTAAFADNAYLFAQVANANPYTPMPFVPPGGERTQASIGLTPTGTGQNKGDSNPDPGVLASGPPAPMIWCRAFWIHNGASVLEFSFDGTNVHGYVPANTSSLYFDRFEAGIAVRGNGGIGTFKIEAW